MGRTLSPLRYPGGKSQIIKNVQRLIENNGYGNHIYVEPFAGGFGVGLSLLVNDVVQQAVINDSDAHVFHFWASALNSSDALIKLTRDTPITLEEREHQKAIYSDPNADALLDGFATLYLNRVNYSGVLFAGPIGGNKQKSQYSLGCRFNKEGIIRRIQMVAELHERIRLFNLDAAILIGDVLHQEIAHSFFNIDPPYVKKGKSLYSEYYTEQGHKDFAAVVREHLDGAPWIVTYDNCDLIKEIYQGFNIHEFELYHSAYDREKRTELIITNIPDDQFHWQLNIPPPLPTPDRTSLSSLTAQIAQGDRTD